MAFGKGLVETNAKGVLCSLCTSGKEIAVFTETYI